MALSRQCIHMHCFTFHLINPRSSTGWYHLPSWLVLISNCGAMPFLECFQVPQIQHTQKRTQDLLLNHVCFPKKSIPTYTRVIYPGPSFSCTFYIWSNTRPCWLYLCTDIAWSQPILPHLWANWESWVRWSLSMSWLWHSATTHFLPSPTLLFLLTHSAHLESITISGSIQSLGPEALGVV